MEGFCVHPDNDWDGLCAIEACPLFETVSNVFGYDQIVSFIDYEVTEALEDAKLFYKMLKKGRKKKRGSSKG